MGREEGGGFRMGNTCIPVAIHFDIWQNQYNIVKLNKIKLKKHSGKKKEMNKAFGQYDIHLIRESVSHTVMSGIPWPLAC